MTARITSALFVAQLTRRVFADGSFAAVERKGAEAAGAIFIVTRTRMGEVKLFSPAIQALAGDDGERRFMAEIIADDATLSLRWEREARFDPDFWVVEIETDAPERYLLIAED
ncbi:DUF1491 family protein [Consotaella salsifontis]|uniref:DUF1491 domain-containing protein n=1 Tax=Consotaella salsifontis TaxID=1365950 RepID=A0A1T4MFP7_9HYPH|nr:DUF1491 family protein [Consotaella salsifontis]SJZ65743.1 hypothetical protein SAMN05428963_102101 [Consotaella salsifontis]